MRRSIYLVLLVAGIAALAASAPYAAARNAYVADYETETVSAIDLSGPSLIGSPIPTGTESGPFSLAIAPDGKTAYVVNYDGGTIGTLDTATNLFLGSPIPVREGSYGFAIDPSGTTAYLANTAFGTLEAIDLATRTRIGDPLEVGEGPVAVAISPDGSRAYVCVESAVAVVDTATKQVIATIPTGNGPYTSAITPDGRFLFVPHDEGVSVIDTAANQIVGPLIPIGEKGAEGVAITPDGSRAYVVGEEPNELTVLDVATKQVIATVPIPAEMEFLAITPDGKRLLIEQDKPGQLSFLDTTTNQIVGSPVVYGERDGQVAVVPDQSPRAGMKLAGRARPGVPYTFDGSASKDADGSVARWVWSFGDKKVAAANKPLFKHTYKKPGKYRIGLTVSDNEGCGEASVFTGQTASCSGRLGPQPARLPLRLTVSYPTVKVSCAAGSRAACKFALRAVERKKGKLSVQSAIARGKARPGKTAKIALKPKKRFAKKLAKAKKALVEQVITTGKERSVKVSKLRIVG